MAVQTWAGQLKLTTAEFTVRPSLTLLTDSFLQTPITGETPDLVVYHFQIVLVVGRRELFGGDGHTDGIGNTLTERTGGHFDAW